MIKALFVLSFLLFNNCFAETQISKTIENEQGFALTCKVPIKCLIGSDFTLDIYLENKTNRTLYFVAEKVKYHNYKIELFDPDGKRMLYSLFGQGKYHWVHPDGSFKEPKSLLKFLKKELLQSTKVMTFYEISKLFDFVKPGKYKLNIKRAVNQKHLFDKNFSVVEIKNFEFEVFTK